MLMERNVHKNLPKHLDMDNATKYHVFRSLLNLLYIMPYTISTHLVDLSLTPDLDSYIINIFATVFSYLHQTD